MKLYSLLSYTLLYSIVPDNRKPLLCNKKMAMDGYNIYLATFDFPLYISKKLIQTAEEIYLLIEQLLERGLGRSQALGIFLVSLIPKINWALRIEDYVKETIQDYKRIDELMAQTFYLITNPRQFTEEDFMGEQRQITIQNFINIMSAPLNRNGFNSILPGRNFETSKQRTNSMLPSNYNTKTCSSNSKNTMNNKIAQRQLLTWIRLQHRFYTNIMTLQTWNFKEQSTSCLTLTLQNRGIMLIYVHYVIINMTKINKIDHRKHNRSPTKERKLTSTHNTYVKQIKTRNTYPIKNTNTITNTNQYNP
ncbi:Hypothetical_protein [Hexamita inflata]|uniref:Hypothetical_protein n=1 Tax=Hexamita inflata TaxID=28002 RepID=A0ABP1I1Z4_9EUKA